MMPLRPPLLNSSSLWASSQPQLHALYDSPHTGAVTTRTSTQPAFRHDPSLHRHVFLSPSSTINTYGYSPLPVSKYLEIISEIVSERPQKKPFIISIAGTPSEVRNIAAEIIEYAQNNNLLLCIEINLSCPNISAEEPPPGYNFNVIVEYLAVLSPLFPPVSSEVEGAAATRVKLGLKLPPYTYNTQFKHLTSALLTAPHCVSFLTSTNTLGSCLHIPVTAASGSSDGEGSPEETYGGLGGPQIHNLALGNVRTLRELLDLDGSPLKDIVVIGVGGVHNGEGYVRMRKAGAGAVGVATALGEGGVGVFEDILKGESYIV